MLSKERQELVDLILLQVKELKEEFGEFYPIGGVMMSNGEVKPFGAFGEDEHPEVKDVIEYIIDAFEEGVLLNKYIAVAFAVDVLFLIPGTNTRTDAVEIKLDSKIEDSINLYVTYKFENGILEFYKMFQDAGTLNIFKKQG